MQSTLLLALGGSFILIGAGLFALTLKKPKAPAPNPKKSDLRDQDELRSETKKMRIGAGVVAGFGVLLLLLS